MSNLRSVVAIAAGIASFTLALFLLQSLTGLAAAVTNAGRLGWIVCTAVSMVLGGFVAASIARRAPTGHALGVGALQAMMTLVAMMTVRTGSEPLWFWIGGILLMMPAAWAGAKARTARQSA